MNFVWQMQALPYIINKMKPKSPIILGFHGSRNSFKLSLQSFSAYYQFASGKWLLCDQND
jgi:hypothetical protein